MIRYFILCLRCKNPFCCVIKEPQTAEEFLPKYIHVEFPERIDFFKAKEPSYSAFNNFCYFIIFCTKCHKENYKIRIGCFVCSVGDIAFLKYVNSIFF